jgi:hypothetical protein
MRQALIYLPPEVTNLQPPARKTRSGRFVEVLLTIASFQFDDRAAVWRIRCRNMK